MKVKDLRRLLDGFASLLDSSRSDKAQELRRLAAALEPADNEQVAKVLQKLTK